ncbi:hypothetical protein N7509_013792 [Penicillium cosmopolitanum]|uniref:TIGR02453 family protein n=1 Tax=Penicillium cosmopolitanum TaxID=1131564 RepID=A0A9W9SE13_9EURO|nr:uncharacterized protein N7509_013792 [Penicillium cosmopolitanum]KAJ5376906.1 hypothetical protein N7509_013792 [Penicillium cosmopolitanum]
MSRRSSRAAPAAQAPEAAPKRRASTRLSASEAEVKRVRSNIDLPGSQVKTTTKKSKYFEPEGSAESEEPASDTDEDEDEDEDEDHSAYEENDVDPESDDHEPSDQDDEPDSEEETKGARAKGGKAGKGRVSDAASLKGKELWREGVRTGLAPGQEVIVPKPKARDPGDVPYEDETLHPNTRLFLLDLAKNNEREWLKGHDPDYRASKKDFETFVEALTGKLAEHDSTVPELPAKDLVFRIHRDVRFSKNPLPYKIHFSAAWSRTGKKGPYAAYYVHFQPGSCFVGCGLWQPEAEPLRLLREDIDAYADQWKELLRAPEMRREFLGGAADDDEAVVKAFAHHNRESALKTKPKGYDADHPNIQLLRLRSFTLGRPISDADMMAADAQHRIAALVAVMEPFVTYLNSVVMPDS